LSELEEHLLLCGECQRVVVKLDSDASSRGRPLEITHVTADALIQLWVEQSLSGSWLARYTGHQLDAGQEFGNIGSARTFACNPSLRCSPITYVPTPARSCGDMDCFERQN